ncbi:MAG TPA: Gfo/Idh/MocA family oxidoreductase [Herpetosiphonaceae bacterium]
MSAQIRTAILGPGKVAQTHAGILASLPQSQFVAVCGRDQTRTASFAAPYGVRAYTDLGAMLHQQKVQMLVVCTPHPQHAEQAILAAEAGVHVLIEKPMALTAAECDRMIAAADRAGVKLGVISQRRLYPPVQRVRAAIDQGKIGQPILGTLTLLGWRSAEYYAMDAWRGTWQGEGGGVLVNQAVHQLDLFQWLMGPIAEVSGYVANLNHPTIEVEDTAVAVARFTSGALGAIVASNSQNPGLYGNVHIHGSNGAAIGVQTDGGSMFISGVTTAVEPAINDVWTVAGEAEHLDVWQEQDRRLASEIDVMSYYHQLQIEDFLQAILDDRPPLVPGDEGRKAVELFEAIYRSQQEQRPIRLPPTQPAEL